MGFVYFMASAAGRGLRILIGLGLIYWGYRHQTETAGMTALIFGFLPLLSGVFNICIFALLFGAPLSGSKLPPRA